MPRASRRPTRAVGIEPGAGPTVGRADPLPGAPAPKITGITITEFSSEVKDMGLDYNGFNWVYEPGGRLKSSNFAIQVFTDQGITGEYIGWGTFEPVGIRMFAHYLIGKNALEREQFYTDVKRALRQVARVGMAPVDVALWDIAGKYYNAPLYQLLGGKPRPIPAYASTYHGDHVKGSGLDTPEGFADFAEECYGIGYRAFKLHIWGADTPIQQQAEAVRAVGRRVGGRMALLVDPACELMTFGQALQVGWACDDYHYFWWEDPFRDGGISQFAHRKLRQLVKTPLLQTEHVRSLEPHIDFAIAEATDFVRGDIGYDGITGVLKIAHACEGLGIDIEFHGGGPAVRHMMCAVRNTNFYELGLVHPKIRTNSPSPVYETEYREDLDGVDKNGCVHVPQDGPGLAVKLNWDWINKHKTGGVEYK